MTVDAELDRILRQIHDLEVIRDYLQARKQEINGAGRRTRRKLGKVTASDAAAEVLAAAGAPMRTRDLLAEVQQRGARMKDGEGLTKTLARSDRFVKVGRGLWTLA